MSYPFIREDIFFFLAVGPLTYKATEPLIKNSFYFIKGKKLNNLAIGEGVYPNLSGSTTKKKLVCVFP